MNPFPDFTTIALAASPKSVGRDGSQLKESAGGTPTDAGETPALPVH